MKIPFYISVIIPTYNDSENDIKKILLSLNNQTFFPKEIIFIDSSDNDHSKKIIENFETLNFKIRYHHVSHAYPGKARNIGVQLSQEEWIGFLDSKTMFSKGKMI